MSQPRRKPTGPVPKGPDPTQTTPTATQAAAPSAPPTAPPTGKYGALIQKAKSGDVPFDNVPFDDTPFIEPAEDQHSGEPESQKSGLPELKEEEVNLSIKVAKRLRRHWASEAKRQDTTLTAVIIGALREKFGEPQDE